MLLSCSCFCLVLALLGRNLQPGRLEDDAGLFRGYLPLWQHLQLLSRLTSNALPAGLAHGSFQLPSPSVLSNWLLLHNTCALPHMLCFFSSSSGLLGMFIFQYYCYYHHFNRHLRENGSGPSIQFTMWIRSSHFKYWQSCGGNALTSSFIWYCYICFLKIICPK